MPLLVFKGVIQCNRNTSNNNMFEEVRMRHLCIVSNFNNIEMMKFLCQMILVGVRSSDSVGTCLESTSWKSIHVVPPYTNMQIAVRAARNSPDENDEYVQSFLIVVFSCLMSKNKRGKGMSC